MANENGTKKPNFFVRVGRWFKNLGVKIGKAFYNMFHEMKKVTWPTKSALVVVMGVVIGLFDMGAGALVRLITG